MTGNRVTTRSAVEDAGELVVGDGYGLLLGSRRCNMDTDDTGRVGEARIVKELRQGGLGFGQGAPLLQPSETTEQPTVGFHVASVHSILLTKPSENLKKTLDSIGHMPYTQ